jgi:hypothetical protein
LGKRYWLAVVFQFGEARFVSKPQRIQSEKQRADLSAILAAGFQSGRGPSVLKRGGRRHGP